MKLALKTRHSNVAFRGSGVPRRHVSSKPGGASPDAHQQDSKSPKVLIFYSNFGPYHHARIEALARLCNITAVEIARSHREFGWSPAGSPSLPNHITLSTREWEDLHPMRAARLLWSALDRVRPDVVLVPGHGTLAAFAAGAWCRLHHAKATLMSISTVHDRPRRRWKERVKRRLLPAFFDSSVAAGQRAAAYMESLGFARPTVTVVGNVVDNGFYRSCVERLRNETVMTTTTCPIDTSSTLVGSPRKRTSNYCWMLDQYTARGGQCDLVLVGDGPLNDPLRVHAGRLPCSSSIRFEGRRDLEGLLPYYAFAEALGLPA